MDTRTRRFTRAVFQAGAFGLAVWAGACFFEVAPLREAPIDGGNADVSDVGLPDAFDVDADTAYERAVRADNPLAYWRFGESSGTVAVDEIAQGNGTYVGDCTLREKGAIRSTNTALLIREDSGCKVDLGDRFAVPGRTPFSVELWVRGDKIDNQVNFILTRDTKTGPAGGFRLSFAADFLFFTRLTEAGEKGWQSAGSLSPGLFSHLVATYDGAHGVVYLNGAIGPDGPPNVADAGLGPGLLVVGSTVRNAGTFLIGAVDELAIYGYPLTSEQVTAHYKAGLGLR